MAGKRILLVEDEAEIVELLEFNLAKAGFETCAAMTGESALQMAQAEHPDLVVLDLMLPGIDGLEVCRRLREDPGTRDLPIVMVTARGEESDVVVGLELGADDYVTKPFSPRVLIARLRAVLRRRAAGETDAQAVIRIHDLVIHPGRHEVLVEGEAVVLTATEFRVLHCLARRPGWVLTRDQIVDALHGPGYPVTDRAVDVQIVGLRKKLGSAGNLIETVRGIGYRLKE